MPVSWNPTQARYRDTATGRYVSKAALLNYVDQGIVDSGNALQRLALAKAATFKEQFKQELKEEAIRQYMLGRGGLGSMQPSDWGRVGAYLKEQYKYLDGFTEALPGLSEAQAASRAMLYAKAQGAAFQLGYSNGITVSGLYTEERWLLGDAEHCSDCEALGAKGWVKLGSLGTVPRAGATACLVNCECQIQYR